MPGKGKGRKVKKGGDGEGMFGSVSGVTSSVSNAFSSLNPFGSKEEKKVENPYPSSDSSYYSPSTVGGRRKKRRSSKKRKSMRGGDFTDNTETGLASSAASVESEGKMFGGRKTKRRSRKNKRSKSKSRRC